jgi:diadenosine tetraphosphatase ApaH/serine/threonine PP2A family protein phosphatase
MEHLLENQNEHIEALRGFYDEVNQRTNHQYSLTDVVITWLTEGHAEIYRQEQIKKRALVVS